MPVLDDIIPHVPINTVIFRRFGYTRQASSCISKTRGVVQDCRTNTIKQHSWITSLND